MSGTPAIVRSLALLAPVLAGLAACKIVERDEDASAAAGDDTAQAAGNLIECAVGGAGLFERTCEVERIEQEDGSLLLVVRHPNGGFRRFDVLTDGRGLATADGAQEAQAELVDGRLDVSVGSDRYRFPATIRIDEFAE